MTGRWITEVKTGNCIGLFDSINDSGMVRVIRSVPGFPAAPAYFYPHEVRNATFWEFLFARRYKFGMMDIPIAILLYAFCVGTSAYCAATTSEFDPAWSRWAVIAFLLVIAFMVVPYMQWRNFIRRTV